MSVRTQDRVASEIERLRIEYISQRDPAKSSQLYAAMQALEWANSPENAVAPTWVILAGKAHPLMTDIQAG